MVHVVSILAPTLEGLRAEAERQAPLADLVELRLDAVPDADEEALAELFKAVGKPVVVALHGPEAFGSFAGSVEERLEILQRAARAGARFVDVDWTLSLDLGEVPPPCHRIVSRHDTEGTPEDLAAFDEEVRAVLYEGDVIKLVTHAANTEDGLRMLRHLRHARGGLIAFCSGEAGSFTRVLAPIFGSPFTYSAPALLPGSAALGATAPGQLRLDELLGILPPGGVGPATGVLGVVGRPIGHSLSPRVQGMAFKRAGFDAVYLAFEPDDFDVFLDLADDPVFRGFSVTAPFKERALARAEAADSEAREAGAANTLVREGTGWRATNSDAPAVQATLEAALPLLDEPPREGLVLGAGGAARAALRALQAMGLEALVAARRPEAAQALAKEFGCRAVDWDAIGRTPHDVLVHCTPVGTGCGDPEATDPEQIPVPADWIRPGTLVLDAVYRPLRTPLMVQAAARGAFPIPGAEWFLRQALAQYKTFTSAAPDEPLMRAALEGALGLASDEAATS